MLTDVTFALDNLSAADRDRPDVPTKGDIFRYLASDVTKIANFLIMVSPTDKDAIRRTANLYIKPVFKRGSEMLRPILEEDTNPFATT